MQFARQLNVKRLWLKVQDNAYVSHCVDMTVAVWSDDGLRLWGDLLNLRSQGLYQPIRSPVDLCWPIRGLCSDPQSGQMPAVTRLASLSSARPWLGCQGCFALLCSDLQTFPALPRSERITPSWGEACGRLAPTTNSSHQHWDSELRCDTNIGLDNEQRMTFS